MKSWWWDTDGIKLLLVASVHGRNWCSILQKQAALLGLHGNPHHSGGGTKSLITTKDVFGVAFSGILLVLRVDKHVIIETCYLLDVIGWLMPAKIYSCFQEISQEFSWTIISPFKVLRTRPRNYFLYQWIPATVTLLTYSLSKSYFGGGSLALISNFIFFVVCFNNLFPSYHYLSRCNNSSCSLDFTPLMHSESATVATSAFCLVKCGKLF